MKKGKIYTIDGVELEMFTNGFIGKLLNREAQTIRKWEQQGIIPQATYRNASNRRMYTKNQVLAIVNCVRKYELKQGTPIPKEFVEEVKDEFKRATAKDFE